MAPNNHMSRLALTFALVANAMAGFDYNPLNVQLYASAQELESEMPITELRPSQPAWAAVPKVRIFSFDPFIAHIENFVTPSEREYLIDLAAPMLSESTVRHADGSQELSTERTSSTAFLPTNDFITGNILTRAAELQGFQRPGDIQVTSYQAGQQYTPHYDWFVDTDRTTNRLSTFFAILDARCENCGTQFPNIQVDWSTKDPAWCTFVDCSQTTFTTLNIPGSAWYWQNLYSNGTGRHDVLHAGLPALNGTKVGLNVWTEIPV